MLTHRSWLTSSLFCLSLILLAQPSVAAPEAATGPIVEVTLYRGQAQVTRQIKLDGAVGPRELVVSDLPARVAGESLFAEGSAGTEVRAVRYRQRAVGQEPLEQVRKLDAQLQELADRLALNQERRQLVGKSEAFLNGLDGFVVPTSKIELAQGVLNAETLKAITEYSMSKRSELVETGQRLRIEERELNEQIALLRRQRTELTAGSSNVIHEAVVFVEKTAAGPQTLRLSYLVNACGWSPAYNFRGNTQAGHVVLEYDAVIQQMSGEDWNNVKLSLSTATPALSAAVPGLSAFHVALAAPQPPQPSGPKSEEEKVSRYKQLIGGQRLAISANANAVDNEGFNRANWDVNKFGNDMQLLELTVAKDALHSIRQSGAETAGPSLSYELANPVSLASRSDQQMVRIIRTQVDSTFYYVATPVLSPHVYREAELVNATQRDLLGGQAGVYLDGRFVGRMELPTVARGQTFVIGFGADPQLRTSRELVERDQSTQGGNQIMSATYRLTVENFKDQAAAVRVKDRMPYAGMTNEVRVTTGKMSDPLSADALYVRLEKPKNILRWDLEVAANASGDKARSVEYSYQLEFDRNKSLGAPSESNAPAMREEFEALQQQRNTY